MRSIGFVLATCLMIHTAVADPKPGTAAPAKVALCGRQDFTARALKVGNKFAPFEYYSVGVPERIDCDKMIKKSNLPKDLKAAMGNTFADRIGAWVLNGYNVAVDPDDLHTYKYADISFYSDELDIQSRAGNAASAVKSFPRSKHPEDHQKLVAGIKAKPGEAFNDKEVRAVSVITDWADAGKRGGVFRERATVVVGVFDPENKKCWTWNSIQFIRPASGGAPEIETVHSSDVNEIDCKLLRK